MSERIKEIIAEKRDYYYCRADHSGVKSTARLNREKGDVLDRVLREIERELDR